MQLNFTLQINNDSWYPTVEIKDLKTLSGDKANINKKLVLQFTAPGKMTSGDITVSSDPWYAFDSQVESSEISNGIFDIKVTLVPTDGQPIGSAITNIHMGLNKSSDTAPDWSTFSNTFSAAADEEPNVTGSLVVKCAQLPAGLEQSSAELILTRGDKSEYLTLKPGQSTVSLPAGTYRVAVSDLKTEDGTLRAPVNVDLKEVVINKGAQTPLNVTFGAVQHSSTLDVVISLDDIPGLQNEALQLSYLENGVETQRLSLRTGETLRLEQRPATGRFALQARSLKLNNVAYTFDELSGQLNGQYHEVKLTRAQVHQTNESLTGAAKLTLHVSAEKALSTTFDLHLSNGAATPRRYAFDNIPAMQATSPQTVALIPDTYTIETGSFVNNGTVYYVDVSPNPLVVKANTPVQLNVNIVEGANLQVKGFPDYLTFGGCADMSPSNVDDLAEARVTSVFKYSGDDGMGDAGGYLDPAKEPTSKIIEMARNVSAKTSDTVIPFMVSYTCNLSLGDVPNIIKDPVRHQYSFANFIQSLKMAQATQDAAHPVPAGYIVNPDYLGECQKYGYAPTYPIPVRKPLSDAMAHHGVNVAIPAGITDTLKGYIKAVNWLVRVVAPDVVLGWQINLWSVGGSQWVYNDFSYDDVFDATDGQHKKMTITPELAGKLSADYALLVGVFEDTEYQQANGQTAIAKGADFMAADRYEADDFTGRAFNNGYCYSPNEWDRTFDFCASLSRHLRKPVMPWQIPASRLATQDEQVGEMEAQFWGTGGSYLMGHPEIGDSVEAINEKLLNLNFLDVHAAMMGHTARELFNRHAFDVSQPKYQDFPARGIFHVQVGGGATTGVVSAVNNNSSSWMRPRLKAYRQHPVAFENNRAVDKAKK